MEKFQKGLMLQVYRPDIQLNPFVIRNGITENVSGLTLVGYQEDPLQPLVPLEGIDLAVDVGPDAPAVILAARGADKVPLLIPLEYMKEDGTHDIPDMRLGPVDGGNLAGSTDFRWFRLLEKINCPLRLGAIPVYDSIITHEEYFEKAEQHKESAAKTRKQLAEYEKAHKEE